MCSIQAHATRSFSLTSNHVCAIRFCRHGLRTLFKVGTPPMSAKFLMSHVRPGPLGTRGLLTPQDAPATVDRAYVERLIHLSIRGLEKMYDPEQGLLFSADFEDGQRRTVEHLETVPVMSSLGIHEAKAAGYETTLDARTLLKPVFNPSRVRRSIISRWVYGRIVQWARLWEMISQAVCGKHSMAHIPVRSDGSWALTACHCIMNAALKIRCVRSGTSLSAHQGTVLASGRSPLCHARRWRTRLHP